MKLFDTVDGLLVGTRYLSWALGVLGIIGSVILCVVNFSMGFASAAVFIAAFFLAVGVVLLLLPKKLAKGKLLGGKKYIAGSASLLAAMVIMGIIWLSCGGFPALNLIFI